MKANFDIRMYAAKRDIRAYEIARKLGMQDTSFSRLLRFELSEQKRLEIMRAIDDIAKEQKKC